MTGQSKFPALTLKVNAQFPVSPDASESVPETTYDPTARAPVVVIKPALLTVTPGLAVVVTNVTVPWPFATVIGPALKVADEVLSTDAVVGDV